jgi:signal transduction histidine kinase
VKSHGDLLIRIDDDGIGIPARDKEIIFERGYGKNTGLGLFLSREILSITNISIKEAGEFQHGARLN